MDSAKASQDVAMPGPNPWWSEGPLLAAVQSGEVPMAAIDRKVRRILTLAARVGALEGFEPVAASPVHVEDGIAFVREAEAEGTVLVRNTASWPRLNGCLRVTVGTRDDNDRFLAALTEVVR